MSTQNNNSKKGLVSKIVLWSLFAILTVGTILIYVFSKSLYGEGMVITDEAACTWVVEPLIPYTVSNWKFAYSFYWCEILDTIKILGCCIAGAVALHYISKINFGGQKVKTIIKLVLNFLKWVIMIAAFFLILSAWGMEAKLTAASAGILALIIGLGSQTLVADILAGIFIAFEGDFQVGDIVIIDGWRGEVQVIGIRTTKLIDAGGNIKIVNNSEIKTIINQTKELSIAKCYVGTRYEDRIENIEAVIADNLAKVKEKIPAIVEGPYYKGVSELAESSVNLLFVAKCKEEDIYQVQRDMNREIKIMFDNNNIGIPFNQIVVHMGEDDDAAQTVSKKTIQKAEEFAEAQKELSKDIDIKR